MNKNAKLKLKKIHCMHFIDYSKYRKTAPKSKTLTKAIQKAGSSNLGADRVSLEPLSTLCE